MKTKIKGLPKGQRKMLEVILGKECPKYVEDITSEQEAMPKWLKNAGFGVFPSPTL